MNIQQELRILYICMWHSQNCSRLTDQSKNQGLRLLEEQLLTFSGMEKSLANPEADVLTSHHETPENSGADRADI